MQTRRAEGKKRENTPERSERLRMWERIVNHNFTVLSDVDQDIVICKAGEKLLPITARLTDEGSSVDKFPDTLVIFDLEFTQVVC